MSFTIPHHYLIVSKNFMSLVQLIEDSETKYSVCCQIRNIASVLATIESFDFGQFKLHLDIASQD